MAIGDDASIGARDETRAENIYFYFGAVAFEGENWFSVAILQRLAILIDPAVTEAAASGLIVECDGDVEQADGLHVRGNNTLRGLALIFEIAQARIGFCELLLQARRRS